MPNLKDLLARLFNRPSQPPSYSIVNSVKSSVEGVRQAGKEWLSQPVTPEFRNTAPIQLLEGAYNTPNPLVRVPMQVGAGVVQGANMGLGRSPYPPPQSTAEKIAYGGGALVGSSAAMMTPYTATGAFMKTFNTLTNPIVRTAISPVASNLIGGRLAAAGGNVAQGMVLNKVTGRENTPLTMGLDALAGLISGPRMFAKPMAKGMDFGRNRYSSWSADELGSLEKINTILSTKKVVTQQEFSEIDKNLTYLAKSHVPEKTIQKLANDYGSNDVGFTRALAKELTRLSRNSEVQPNYDYAYGVAPPNAKGVRETVKPPTAPLQVNSRETALEALKIAKKSKQNIQIEVANPQGTGTKVMEVTPKGEVIDPVEMLPSGKTKDPLALPSGKKIVANSQQARAAFEKGYPVEYHSVVKASSKKSKNLITPPPDDYAQRTPGFRTIPSSPAQAKSGLRQAFERWFVDTRQQMQSMGSAGKFAAAQMDNYVRLANKIKGNWQARYVRAIEGLSDEQMARILKYQEGKIPALTSQELKAWKEINAILTEVSDNAQTRNLTIERNGERVPFAPRENYVPHFADRDKIKQNAQLVIDHLVGTNQMKPEDAKAFVEDVVRGLSVRDAYLRRNFPGTIKRYGHLENSRILDLPEAVLRNDKAMLLDYFEGAGRRLAQAEIFGANNEDVERIVSQIGRDGGNAQLAQEFFDRNFGVVPRTPEDVLSRTIRGVQSAAKLPLFAVSNASQSVNTATMGGTRRTMDAIASYLGNSGARREMQDFYLRTGEAANALLEDFARDVNSSRSSFLSQITGPGGNVVEEFNRIIAATVGKKYAQDVVNQLLRNPNDRAALKALEKLGLDAGEILAKGRLDDGDLIKAAQVMVEKTQFRVNQADLPPAWNTTWGKVISQYKQFAYKQGKFILDEVVGEMGKGNLAPMARYLLLGSIVGEVTADIKDLIYQREKPSNLPDRLTRNVMAVGGVGIFQDMYEAAKGLMSGTESGRQRALGFVLGPTGGDLVKLTGAIQTAVKGQTADLGRLGMGYIPLVGGIGSRYVFPYDSQKYPVGYKMVAATTPAGRTKQKGQITDKLDNAKAVAPTELDFYYLYKADHLPANSSWERVVKQQEYLKTVKTVMNDERLSPEQKGYLLDQIASKTALNKDQLMYSYIADQSEEARLAFVMDALQQAQTPMDRMRLLASGKLEIGGNAIVTSGIITALEGQGVLSKDEAKALRKITFTGTKLNKATTLRGGSTKKLPKIKFKSPKYTIPKVSKAKVAAIKIRRPTFGKIKTKNLKVKL